MTTKKRYKVLLVFLFIFLSSICVYGISVVFSFLNTGADRASILHLPIQSVQVYLPKIKWSSLENPGRPMEEQTLKEIQKDYLNAWHIKNIAYRENNPYGIKDYYTDSVQKNLINTIKYNESLKLNVETTTLQHQPKLNFYSADGQLVTFTDENVVEYQRVFKDGKFVFDTELSSTYHVMMLLEDGFWRIRHLVKDENEKKLQEIKGSQFATTKNDSIFLNNIPFKIQGINYYPQETPWDMFGKKFNTEIIDKDFKFISDLKLNTIRIFVQYEDFGKANVKPEKLKKLEETINLAEKHNLKVIVTLFDFYGDYAVQDWTLTHRHAENIVTYFKDNTTIIAWDIKNEPDLDFKNRGEQNVLKWLEYMTKEIKKHDPNHLITIGWSNFKAAKNLTNTVDLVSFHHFNDNFENDFSSLKETTKKPILVEEFGVPSYKSIWNLFMGDSKKSQAKYHKKMQGYFTKYNVSHMSWTLYDFTKIPSSVAGKMPWKRNKQKHFGFIDKDGNKKPSFEFITPK
ncbi:cellulase family glycosylhydrolase [uncultured Tenacibaculum sp.]|uniref:cellulase family glycosylhydrolase n=1 Tax=uncultured Tenacibaculum sp. TaxID=174713 RepID=UPI002639A9B6|nr:cellulase family glycosylhydrolase [uncultured Tenacibaculum sp.]